MGGDCVPIPSKWVSVRRVNGVAIYHEDEGPDNGGSYMVSCIIR